MSSSLVTSHLIRHASPGPLSFISFSSFSPSATTKHNTEIKLIVTKNKDTIFCNIIEIAWERGNSRKRYLSSDANVSSFLLAESPPRDLQLNNYLKIMVCSCVMLFNCFWLQILFCSCIIETALFSFLRSLLCKNGRSLRFPKIFLKKQTRWSNDKTIIELGYRKISWFVSVSQINYYLPQPLASANNWSARHWQIFCSTSSNNY